MNEIWPYLSFLGFKGTAWRQFLSSWVLSSNVGPQQPTTAPAFSKNNTSTISFLLFSISFLHCLTDVLGIPTLVNYLYFRPSVRFWESHLDGELTVSQGLAAFGHHLFFPCVKLFPGVWTWMLLSANFLTGSSQACLPLPISPLFLLSRGSSSLLGWTEWGEIIHTELGLLW